MANAIIDLNLDGGEAKNSLEFDVEQKILTLVSSVNVACGGHTGDRDSMAKTVERALGFNVAIGAHPSFPDRENFGRKPLLIEAERLSDSVCEQIEALKSVCASQGAKLQHVKPHGALYNLASTQSDLAQTLISAIIKIDPSLKVVGLSQSKFLALANEQGLKTYAEGFCDRVYEPSGSLRDRSFADALLTDPNVAASQALALARHEPITCSDQSHLRILVQTICLHGDSANAMSTAVAVYKALRGAGFEIKALGQSPPVSK